MPKKKKRIALERCNYKHQQYCFNKGFIIYPKPIDGKGNNFKVWYQLGHKGKYLEGGKVYNKQESFQAIWDLYTKIYEYDKNK